MNLLFWGLTISVVGKVFLAIGVLRFHSEIVHEHRIDAKVIRTFHTERWLTILGVMLIVVGYAMEIYFYGLTPMLTCIGDECAAAMFQPPTLCTLLAHSAFDSNLVDSKGAHIFFKYCRKY